GTPELFVDVLEHLSADVETLDDEVIASFEVLADRLGELAEPPPAESSGDEDGDASEQAAVRAEQAREARTEARASLRGLAGAERQLRPTLQVMNILRDRLPS